LARTEGKRPRPRREWRLFALPRFEDEEATRRDPTQRHRGLYVALAAVVLLASSATILFPNSYIADRFGPNLATESGAILITLVFVQRFLEQQERARRLRGSIGGLRKGRRALFNMVEAWGVLLKGSMRRPPPQPPESFTELFAPYVTENLSHFDPATLRPSADGADDTWLRIAAQRLRAGQDALNHIIVVYGASLDSGYVEVIDELADDPFLSLIDQLAMQTAGATHWRMRLNALRAQREAHFRRLLRVVELHNALSSEAGLVRSPGEVPRTGALGVELSPDHDLRIDLAIPPEWWRAAPAPGALRAENGKP
jgi:hypothetical protein